MHRIATPSRLTRWWPALSLVVVLGLLSGAQAQDERREKFGKKGPDFWKKGPDARPLQDKRAAPASTTDRVKELEEQVHDLKAKLSAAYAKGGSDKGERKGPPAGMWGKWGHRHAAAWQGKHHGSHGDHAYQGKHGGHHRHHAWHHGHDGRHGYHGSQYAAHHRHHAWHHRHHHDTGSGQAGTSDLSRRVDRLQREVEELRAAVHQRRR